MIRRFFYTLLFLFIYICLGCSFYSKSDPPTQPGQFIHVDQNIFHVFCKGSGTPLVWLEAGAGSFSAQWTLFMDSLSQYTRVCSYDRLGLGWSNLTPPRSDERNAKVISQELNSLLAEMKIEEPFILIGHSLGSLYSRVFASLYPQQVSQIILIDPSPVYWTPTGWEAGIGNWVIRNLWFLNQIGFNPFKSQLRNSSGDLPESSQAAMDYFYSQRTHIKTLQSEFSSYSQTRSLLLNFDASLVDTDQTTDSKLSKFSIFSAENPVEASQEKFISFIIQDHKTVAKLYPNGQHSTLPGCNHITLVSKKNCVDLILRDLIKQLMFK